MSAGGANVRGYGWLEVKGVKFWGSRDLRVRVCECVWGGGVQVGRVKKQGVQTLTTALHIIIIFF